MRAPLSHSPLLPILLSFIIGILVTQLDIPILWSIAPIIIGIFLYLSKRPFLAIILLVFSLGIVDADINKADNQNIPSQQLYYQAEVINANEKESSTALIVSITNIGISPDSTAKCRPIKCLLSIPATSLDIYPNDIISFITTLEAPHNDISPDAFDYANYLYNNGISATTLVAPEDISVIGHRHSIFGGIRQFSYDITSLIHNSNLDEQTAYFLNATIVGDASAITQEQRLEYSSVGIAHILALSGLHVGIIIIVINILLAPLYFTRKRKICYIITIVLLWLYAILTGMSPSVTRAVIMATLYLGSIILQRHHSSLNALCFAALAILVVSPFEIFDVGFQLSFIAVATILLFTNKFNPINPRRRILYNITGMLVVSVAAMLGTGIVAAYYFHNFPIYFLVGNVAASLFLPPLIGGGIFLIILQSLNVPTDWLCCLLDWLYSLLNFVTNTVNSLPGASINNIYFPSWVMGPYFIAISSLLVALHKRRLVYTLASITLLIFCVVLSWLMKPIYPTIEFFIPQDTYFTNIIYRDSTSAYLITTAPHQDANAMLTRCQFRHRDFLGKRDCGELKLLPDTIELLHLIRAGNKLTIGNTNIVIIKNTTDVYPINKHSDYTLVCRGYRGNIIDIVDAIPTDTILLSNDLHPRRHDQYADECINLKQPYRSLKTPKVFHITQP